MAEIPAISDVPAGSPDIIRELKLAVDTLAGRIGGNVDYGTIDGVRTKVLDIVHLCDMINQLHESGVTKADLEKLRDITVEAAPIGKIKAKAHRNAAQNIDASGYTKVAIDTVSFDTESVADVTTNNRITPTLPGYYCVTGNVSAIGVPDGARVTAWIYKNGFRVSVGSYGQRQGEGGYAISIISDLIYMNGTTDYLELYAHNSHSSALTLYTGYSYRNYISIVGPF